MKTSLLSINGISLLFSIFELLKSGICSAQTTNQIIVWGDNSYGQLNVPANATNVIALAAGDNHALALRADGKVVAWGGNYSGQTNVPTDLTNAVSIAAGSTHSLALRSDGTVALWGHIYFGINTVPSEATNVVALALGQGAQHALVLKSDGTVLDWGNDYDGLTNIPVMARNIVSVASGSTYGLALRADGRVVGWGSGLSSIPASATNIVAIATSWTGNAALRADGTLLLWGMFAPSSGFTNIIDLACPFDNTGPDTLALRRNGTLVEYSHTFPKYPTNYITAIAAGSYNAFAVVGSGPPVFPGMPVNRTVSSGSRAYFRMNAVGALPMFYQWTCTGTNLAGATNSVLTLTNVQPNLAGAYYALIASNSFGMTTSAPITLKETPSEAYVQANATSAVVDQTVTFTTSIVGQGPFSYQWQFNGTNLSNATNLNFTLPGAQLSDEGTYSIVVSNSFGLTTNSVSLSVSPTIIINPPQNQIAFPGGTATFTIGVQAIIPVTYQWQFNGANSDGETNNSLILTNLQYTQGGTYSIIFNDSFESITNNVTLSLVPVAAWGELGQQTLPAGLTNLIALDMGESYGLALKADGTLVGWGNGFFAVPVPSGLSNVIAIAAGNNDSLALRVDGTVMAWGSDDQGQTNLPSGLTNVVAIAAGDFHNLALKSDGSVIAWGDNSYGQTNVPIGLTNAVAIAAGEWNCMALKSDGTVVAWGAGTNSTGSDPIYGQSIVPQNLSNVIQITTGGADDAALKSNGSIIAWGANFYGEDSTPMNLSNVVAITAGYLHTAALQANGTVTAWGYNAYGETNVPVGLKNVSAIRAKNFSNLALIGDGSPILQVLIANPTWSANSFSLSLPTQSGRVYALEYKNSLYDSNWTALPLTAGNGGILTVTDSAGVSSQRYYRVRRW